MPATPRSTKPPQPSNAYCAAEPHNAPDPHARQPQEKPDAMSLGSPAAMRTYTIVEPFRSPRKYRAEHLFEFRRGDLNSPPPTRIWRCPAVTSVPERHLATAETATYRSMPLQGARCH